MTSAQLEELIKYGTVVAAAAWGLITWLNNKHKAKIKKIEEESTGKIVIEALQKELREVREAIKDLTNDSIRNKDAIERLEDHYSVLISRIFEIYNLKTLK